MLKYLWSVVRLERQSRFVETEVGESGRVMVSNKDPIGARRHGDDGSGGGRPGVGESGGGSAGGLSVPMEGGRGVAGSIVGATGEPGARSVECDAVRSVRTEGIWPNPTHRVGPYPSHSLSESVGSQSGQQSQSRAQSRWSGVIL